MRPEKQYLVADIQEKITSAQGFVIAKYKQLQPDLSAKLRENLSAVGADVEVVKKRLLHKAANDAGVSLVNLVVDGQVALFFAKGDPFPMTKAILQFCEDHEKSLEVLCGRFEGFLCSAQEVVEIAALPEKDVMRAQLLSVLEAPMASALAVMESVLSAIIYCLQNQLTKKQEV